jgi:DNA-binding beta-propeller fold protein YncE
MFFNKIKIENYTSENNDKIVHINGFNTVYGLDVDEEENIYIPEFKFNCLIKINKKLDTFSFLKIKKNYLSEINFIEKIILLLPFVNRLLNLDNFFLKPHEVFFDHKKNMYISQLGRGHLKGGGRVDKFDTNGHLVYRFGKNFHNDFGFIGSVMSFVDKNDKLYISEYQANKILCFQEKKFVGWIGKKDLINKIIKNNSWNENMHSMIGNLKEPHAVRIGPDNKLYIVDTGNHRILKYEMNGKYLGWIGKNKNGDINNNWSKNGKSISGSELGVFNTPIDLKFFNNFFYVSDCFNNRILKFEISGKCLGWIGKSNKDSNNKLMWYTDDSQIPSFDINGFNRPYGIMFKNDKVYVADRRNHRVKIIKSQKLFS